MHKASAAGSGNAAGYVEEKDKSFAEIKQLAHDMRSVSRKTLTFTESYAIDRSSKQVDVNFEDAGVMRVGSLPQVSRKYNDEIKTAAAG